MTVLVSELLSRIRDDLDEQTQASWTQQQLRRWINEGLDDVSRTSRKLEDRVTFATVAGTSEYTLAASVLKIKQAYFITSDSRYIALQPVAYEQADNIWGQYQTRQSNYPAMYTTIGFPPNLLVKLYPVPSTINTVSLIVARMAVHIDITGATDSSAIDFPEAWMDTVKAYVLMRAHRRDGDPAWHDDEAEYAQKLDTLTFDSDYMAVNREVVFDPGVGYGLPAWLTSGGKGF